MMEATDLAKRQVSYKTLLNKISECELTPPSRRQFWPRGEGSWPVCSSLSRRRNQRNTRFSGTHKGRVQSLPS
jgi:hypothetical protein